MIKKYIKNILERIRRPIITEISQKIDEWHEAMSLERQEQNKYICQLMQEQRQYMAQEIISMKSILTALSEQMSAGTTHTHQVVFDHINTLAQRIDELDRKLYINHDYLISIQNEIGRFHTAWQYKNTDFTASSRFVRMREIYGLFPMHQIANFKFKRLGRSGDGGYMMLDDFDNHKIAYSFGISDDVSWDKDAIASGISDVYMYDHTIDGLPEENKGFHWQKTGIAGIYDKNIPELRTLKQLLEDNKHIDKTGMLLKMDVEGAEWDVLCNSDSNIFNKFSQIVLELHDMNKKENHEKIVKALQNLNKTHALINMHGNNWQGYEICDGFSIPDALEVTYINKMEYGHLLKPYTAFLPADADEKNTDKYSEIILGVWGQDK